MSKTSIEVHKSEMSDEMQREALQVALLAVNMHEGQMDIATYIMTEFERRYGLSWHCIVGNFGSFVRNKPNHFIYFSVGGNNIILFKTD